MRFSRILKLVISYVIPVKMQSYPSEYSGELLVYMVNGKPILDTEYVNYSFNSLHQVFKRAFKKTGVDQEKVKNILILGLGAGSIVQILRTDYGIKAPITAVEIDPAIIKVAQTEFHINKFAPLQIILADAADWIQTNHHIYDIICVDLFIHSEVPSHFLDPSFIEALLRSAHEGSTIYFNVMLVNERVGHRFEHLYNYLAALKGSRIMDLEYIQVEENNRVLIIKK